MAGAAPAPQEDIPEDNDDERLLSYHIPPPPHSNHISFDLFLIITLYPAKMLGSLAFLEQASLTLRYDA